jgi:hypothetical protein
MCGKKCANAVKSYNFSNVLKQEKIPKYQRLKKNLLEACKWVQKHPKQ